MLALTQVSRSSSTFSLHNSGAHGGIEGIWAMGFAEAYPSVEVLGTGL